MIYSEGSQVKYLRSCEMRDVYQISFGALDRCQGNNNNELHLNGSIHLTGDRYLR